MSQKFAKSVVIDAMDLPPEAEEWCTDNDISTHCDHSLGMITLENGMAQNGYDAEYNHILIKPEDHPLMGWLSREGINLKEFTKNNTFYFSVIGT